MNLLFCLIELNINFMIIPNYYCYISVYKHPMIDDRIKQKWIKKTMKSTCEISEVDWNEDSQSEEMIYIIYIIIMYD